MGALQTPCQSARNPDVDVDDAPAGVAAEMVVRLDPGVVAGRRTRAGHFVDRSRGEFVELSEMRSYVWHSL